MANQSGFPVFSHAELSATTDCEQEIGWFLRQASPVHPIRPHASSSSICSLSPSPLQFGMFASSSSSLPHPDVPSMKIAVSPSPLFASALPHDPPAQPHDIVHFMHPSPDSQCRASLSQPPTTVPHSHTTHPSSTPLHTHPSTPSNDAITSTRPPSTTLDAASRPYSHTRMTRPSTPHILPARVPHLHPRALSSSYPILIRAYCSTHLISLCSCSIHIVMFNFIEYAVSSTCLPPEAKTRTFHSHSNRIL
ncbi:hypothetical protein EDD85DRAFT_845863 [Armillaria nabsnona]|nr:hypothetical protein EDD85DRAFT_845863 [Armillaria nabsnona]